MRRFWTRYRWDLPTTLVFMLQASEYHIGAYAKWYRRVADFGQVDRRHKLDPTAKARGLVLIARVLQLLIWLAAVLLILDRRTWSLSLALLLIVAYPALLAALLVVPLWLGQAFIQKPKERAILNRAHATLAAHPGFKIGIAGSYGKTTMKETLATVLAAGKRVAATPGNLNTPLGAARFTDRLTGDEEVLVFELGESQPGDIRQLSELVNPQLGLITGINEAHLEQFGSLEAATATIYELAEYLDEQPVYVNTENAIAKAAMSKGQIGYSQEGCDGWEVSAAKTSLEGTSFTATNGKRKIQAKSGLLGLHQVGPLVAAISVAERLGLSDEEITAGLAATKPFEHRLQPQPEAGGVVIIDDSYNGNPDGVRAVINFMASLKDKRRIYITPGLVEMGTKTAEVHQEIGRQLAAAHIEKILLIRNSVTPHIEQGLGQAKDRVQWYDDMPQLLAALPSLTVAGDVVLIQNDWPDDYA